MRRSFLLSVVLISLGSSTGIAGSINSPLELNRSALETKLLCHWLLDQADPSVSDPNRGAMAGMSAEQLAELFGSAEKTLAFISEGEHGIDNRISALTGIMSSANSRFRALRARINPDVEESRKANAAPKSTQPNLVREFDLEKATHSDRAQLMHILNDEQSNVHPISLVVMYKNLKRVPIVFNGPEASAKIEGFVKTLSGKIIDTGIRAHEPVSTPIAPPKRLSSFGRFVTAASIVGVLDIAFEQGLKNAAITLPFLFMLNYELFLEVLPSRWRYKTAVLAEKIRAEMEKRAQSERAVQNRTYLMQGLDRIRELIAEPDFSKVVYVSYSPDGAPGFSLLFFFDDDGHPVLVTQSDRR